jgi:hypothetical protein
MKTFLTAHNTINLMVYVQLKVQLDVYGFICILYSTLFFSSTFSGAICTEP